MLRMSDLRGRTRDRWCLVSLMLLLEVGACWGVLTAAEPIVPPFGFTLNAPARTIRSAIESHGLRFREEKNENAEVFWVVTGFSQENLSRAILRFDPRGRLFEAELQYERPGWSEEAFASYLDFFRKNLEQRHGPGLVVERTRGAQGTTSTLLECLQWRQKGVRLRVIRFSASSTPKSKRAPRLHYGNISLHYRRMP